MNDLALNDINQTLRAIQNTLEMTGNATADLTTTVRNAAATTQHAIAIDGNDYNAERIADTINDCAANGYRYVTAIATPDGIALIFES